MPNFLSEDNIEQAMVQRLQHLYGYDVLDCYTSDAADLNDGSGRADKREVILRDRLKAAAIRLNDVFKQIDLFGKWADTLLAKDEWRQSFKVFENTITALYEACKPEILGEPVVR